MLEWGLLHYGYVIVFFGTILEGDATLLAASFLAHRGYFRLPLVIAVATLATTLVNQVFYTLARRHGSAFLEKRSAADPRFAKVAGWVRHKGSWLLLASRFLWGLRAAIPAACGATGMRPWVFLLLNLAGAIVWSIPVALAGYAGAHSIRGILRDLKHSEWPIAFGVMLGVAALVWWRTHGEEWKESWKTVREPEAAGVLSVEVLAQPHPHTPRLLRPPGEPDAPSTELSR